MAKNTQEAEVIVTMNGQAAKKVVEEMAREYKRLQDAALAAKKAGNEALGKQLDAQAQKLKKDIQVTAVETKKFADIMKNINGASLKELTGAAKQLRSEINKLKPGTQEFITKSKQLKEVNTRINQLKGSFQGLVAEEKAASLSLKSLATGFNKYFTLVSTGIAAITGLSMAFRKAAQDAAAMDDAYAQVMKTTGLTKEQVEQLNEAFMKMDTRTAREELNRMAYEAGKLGFNTVEQVQQFVEAADVINVALGDVLGQGATLEIAKLAQVFAQSTAALDNLDLKGRMMAVGSAVNQLGKESTASESYMVEFLGRLGGVATQAGLSADQILGYASALDQMKQKVEMSATAFQKMIQQMIKKPEEFVEAARMPLEDFKKLMETDMNGAIQRVLEGFKEMGGFTQLVPVFKDMGLDGARAASVIASLANNLQLVTAAQATANEHIRLGTSMTREYNIMNQSMQAQLEKARKRFKDASIALGQSLNPIMLKSTKLVTYLIKGLATYGKEIKAAIISIAAFTAVVKAHTIAQTLLNTVTKIGATLKATFKTIVLALRMAYLKLTGQLEAAAVAQAELNAVMNTNVYILLASAIAAVTVAIVHYTKKTKEASEATKKLEEIEDRITKAYAEEAGQVQALSNIVHNNNIQLDERKKALEELKKIVPSYHADLTEEGKLINDNTLALDAYLKNLEKMTRMQVLKDEYTKAVQGVVEAQTYLAKKQEESLQRLMEAGGDASEHISRNNPWNPRLDERAYDEQLPLTPYGEAKVAEVEAQERLNEALQVQRDLEARIGIERGQGEQNLSAEQVAINQIRKEYEDLFATIRRENMDNPNEEIAFYREEMEQKIEETRRLYAMMGEENDFTEPEPPTTPSKGETPYQRDLKALEKAQREEENVLRQSYLNREIDKEAYEKAMREINLKYLQEKVDLAKQYGEDESVALAALLNAQMAAVEYTNKEVDALFAQREAWEKAQLEEAEAYQKEMEKLKEEAQKVLDDLNPSAARARALETELASLDKLHEAKFLSEEEYEEAVRKLRKKYADEDLQEKLENAKKYAERVNKVMEQASNFVTALKEAESAKLEAQYQADLTAAGDNAEKREQVEAEYEQKKLDLQKKYADVDMGINIAKAIAAGALAMVEAWASAGGNPILAGVFMALIAATTAAEVATIIAQRNAIKNTTVNSSTSSSTKTGNRTINEGYAEGGYTEDHTTVTTVGEKGTEWVGPNWMVRRNPVLFSNLERYRKQGSHGRKGSVAAGFAEGGFTGETPQGISGGGYTTADIEAAVETAIANSIANGTLYAVVRYGDIKNAKKTDDYFKKQTSRG